MDIERVDVAIIGAGSVGIAVAYYLVRDHGIRSLALIDSRDPMSLTSAQSGENYRNWWPHPTMTAFTDHSITLMEELERAVFEAYTDTLKTRVDTDTPEEMRWLVMFPKFNPSSSPMLRQRYGIVGVTKELTGAWVEADLGEALVQASQDLLPEGHPFVLMSMRGNLYMRTEMSEPDLPRLQALVRLLETAAREAQRVNGRLSESGAWPTTTSIAWTHSTRPGDA